MELKGQHLNSCTFLFQFSQLPKRRIKHFLTQKKLKNKHTLNQAKNSPINHKKAKSKTPTSIFSETKHIKFTTLRK